MQDIGILGGALRKFTHRLPATSVRKAKLNPFEIRRLYAAALTVGLSLNISTGAEFTDANWTALGSGVNAQVYALAVLGSNVYAGGRFTMAGGVPVGCVAKWDGSAWTRLGSGMNGYVYTLAVSGTNLYAGGSFSTAGGVSAHNIAKWNGSSWTALGQGFGQSPYYSAYVYALAVSGSNVYAGGSFGTAGFATVHNIAKWNGSSWSALGAGTSGYSPSPDVLELAVSGGNLYVGGDFTTAGSVTVNHIGKWDGFSWAALGSGMGSGNAISVYALTVSGSSLYAGGLFTSAGGAGAADVAKWNGNSWSPLGVGMYISSNYYPSVHALAMHGTDLYAGGDFTKAGGSVTNRNEANRIAKWDGNSWSALGSGMNGTVRALAVSGSDLYAGGQFTSAGGKTVGYVARAYLPTLPFLSTIHSGANVTISWPSANTDDFELELTDKQSVPAAWVKNTAGITNDGTNRSLTLPATNSARFFRLRRP